METILGIDLGTTNSVAAFARGDKIEVLELDGLKILPSVVGMDPNGELLVGTAARNQWLLAPDRTVRSVKRKMGSDEKVQLGDRHYSPQEISAIILRTLKQRAESVLGESIRRAVITVPAFFGEQQREATREAGELAGFEVARIINEPTAASLAYQQRLDACERLLVYDLGGGTFDVSIVQIEDGIVEVLASHGDTQLGGDDFDQLLLDHVCGLFQKEHDIDLRETATTQARALHACELAKIRLSDQAVTRIEEEFIAEKAGVARHLNMELVRHEYEQLIESLLNKTLVCVDEALSDAKIVAADIDRVILVGGASRTPLVHQMLADQLGRPVHLEVDPDLCVAVGAGTQGAMIAGIDVGPVLVDITPRTLGIQCKGILYGMPSPFAFAPLIRRNTPLPASKSNIFLTCVDGQETVAIKVHQGEENDVRHNELVGEFTLDGLADVDRGNEILVRFDMDLDGILTVTATERGTGLEKQVVLDNVMSRYRDQDQHAAQDRVNEVFEASTLALVSPDDSALDVPEIVATESIMDAVPETMRPAVQKATDLIDRSLELAEKAAEQDQQEIRQLVEQLRKAIADRSEEAMQRVSHELDDLVFYLQDA